MVVRAGNAMLTQSLISHAAYRERREISILYAIIQIMIGLYDVPEV